MVFKPFNYREPTAEEVAARRLEAQRVAYGLAPVPTGGCPTMIYFVEAATVMRVKIGLTQDLRARFLGLRAMSPVPLRLVAAFRGDFLDEPRLHQRFARWRHHGEWFRRHEELNRLIERVAADHPLPDWAQTATRGVRA